MTRGEGALLRMTRGEGEGVAQEGGGGGGVLLRMMTGGGGRFAE